MCTKSRSVRDGRFLSVVGGKEVRLWAIRPNGMADGLCHEHRLIASEVTANCAFSRDSRRAAVWVCDESWVFDPGARMAQKTTVQFLNLHPGPTGAAMQLPGRLDRVAFSRGGDIALMMEGKYASTYDSETGRPLGPKIGNVIAYSPDCRTFLRDPSERTLQGERASSIGRPPVAGDDATSEWHVLELCERRLGRHNWRANAARTAGICGCIRARG